MPRSPLHALTAEFEAFYDEHFAFVWRALRAFGVGAEQLEDAAQDVFLVVHRRFGTWREPSPRPWLYGVARRVAASRRRGQQRHERKLEALPIPDNVRAIDERVAARRQLERIAALIDALAPERREVYVLAELQGLRPPEIAELIGCKLNTVYSRLRRARRDLSVALAEAGLDPRAHAPAVSATAGSKGRHD